MAGIIGCRKFCYDLWKATGNTARWMEAIASRETIQITKAVYEKLKGRYRFEGPTAVPVIGNHSPSGGRVEIPASDF